VDTTRNAAWENLHVQLLIGQSVGRGVRAAALFINGLVAPGVGEPPRGVKE
jgi:hypothetical protein